MLAHKIVILIACVFAGTAGWTASKAEHQGKPWGLVSVFLGMGWGICLGMILQVAARVF